MNIDDKLPMENEKFPQGKEYYRSAAKAFVEGNYRESFEYLSLAFNEDITHKPCYELAYKCLESSECPEAAELFKKVLENFNDYKAFYEIGYYYIDTGCYRLAVPFLKRALELSGGNYEIAIELSVAYTSQCEPEKGLELLKNVDLGRDFWAWYQYYWCALLSDQSEWIEKFINEARACFRGELLEGDGDIAALYYVLDKLEQCLVRYNTIDKSNPIIRDWHYIQYGAAILDCYKSNGGRYLKKIGTFKEVMNIVYKLKTYLDSLEFYPEKVYYLADKDSEVLGRIIAKVLKVDCEEYYNKTIREKYLIVAADNRDYNVCPELALIRKNEMIFAFNHHWLENSLITPDISGLMSQSYNFPWREGCLNEELKESGITEESSMIIEEVLKAIDNISAEVDDEFQEVLQFYSERKEYLKTGEKGGSGRLAFNTDTPVKSLYVC